jgi:predicted alpha/beta-fold hydrolase
MSSLLLLPSSTTTFLSKLFPRHNNPTLPNKLTLITLLYILYYYFKCVSKPKIYYSTNHHHHHLSPLTNKIYLKCQSTLQKWYWPNPLFTHGYLHSIVAEFLRIPATGLTFTREFLSTRDGGRICLSWVDVIGHQQTQHFTDETPILIVLPGVHGDEYTSWYLKLACKEAHVKYKWRTVVYVRRGCQITMDNGLSQDYYDAQKLDGDFALAIQTITQRYPKAKLLGLGYSLGGNYLTNFLGSRKEKSPFTACATVGCPFDVCGISYYVEHEYKMVDWFLRMNKIKCIQDNYSVISTCNILKERGVNMNEVLSAESFRAQCEYDNLKTWGEAGETLNRYLDRCSCIHNIIHVKTPTLYLCSLDDPVSHALFIPRQKILSNPNVLLITTESGGHHAFGPLNLFQLPWCDELVLEWLRCGLLQ